MLTAVPARPSPVQVRRRGSSATRQRILAASMHLFAREGFSRTTVRGIARRAGITDAAIYYHFSTKEEVLQEILRARLDADRLVEREMCSASVRERIHDAVHGITRILEKNHELVRIILREGLAGDPVAAHRYRQLVDDWEARVGGPLLHLESAGALASGEARRVARQIVYITIGAFEDMLLLRQRATVPPGERRLRALVFLSRSIDRLLSFTGNSGFLSTRAPATADGCERTS